MIPVRENTKIFVLCPAYSKTGGPELLHQLVYVLSCIGVNATIAYYSINNNDKKYTPDDFKQYIETFEIYDNIQDSPENYIIFPEVITKEVLKFKKAKKIIWWLSVDNYFKQRGVRNSLKLYKLRGTLSLIRKRSLYINDKHLKQADYNLCQSYYAMNFLKKKGAKNVYYLSDYINDSFLSAKPDYSKKEDLVLYNPKKGFHFTQKLIERSPELNWTPIEKLSTEQVRDLLLKSKVYIDFGNHPGKDRFPREAAMCGCCVITSKNGSAGFVQDVPIAEQYKFDDKDENIDAIIGTIKHCIASYDEEVSHFEAYRQHIAAEKSAFIHDVREIFRRVQN